MASNRTVKVHLETYLKNYVIQELSSNQDEPVILKKNSLSVNHLMTLLISKREYEHRKIIEKELGKHLDNELQIMLPWRRGKVDIRTKQYISPHDEKKFRDFIKSSFYYHCYDLHRTVFMQTLNTHLMHKIILELAEKYGFNNDMHFESVKRKIYKVAEINERPLRELKKVNES